MKVCITGWDGFLATKLRTRNEVEWTKWYSGCDLLLHLGSPTFTGHELTKFDAQMMHKYVKDSIKIFDGYRGPIMFASTTGVDDIQIDHGGSTSYNLGKLYLENYLMNNVDQWCILRIGTIVSQNYIEVGMMKPDRVQQRIARGDYSNIEMKDYYLDVDEFVNTTMDRILNFQNGIVEYKLQELSLPQLIKMSK